MEKDIEYLEPHELLAFLAEVRKGTPAKKGRKLTARQLKTANNIGTRDFCMYLLGYRHGLRSEELSRLQLSDVRGEQINIRRVKGSETTLQPLYADANELLDEQRALAAWLKVRGDADGSCFLFTSRKGSNLKRRQIGERFRETCVRIGIRPDLCHVHIIKHSLGAHLIRNGARVEYVQKALGHKDIKSTMAYTNITQRETGVVVARAFANMYPAGAL